jgi:hypothetical protein
MIKFKEHPLEQRDDLLGINQFAKTFGFDRRTVERMVERECVQAMEVMDGDIRRLFINVNTLLKEAKINGMTPMQWAQWLNEHSKS